MTLRSDIHGLVDEVTARDPIDTRAMLAAAALDRAARPARFGAATRPSRHIWPINLSWRQPGALAAALIALLVLIALVGGGTFLRNLAHAGQMPGGSYQHELEQLRNRPIKLPALLYTDPCPNGDMQPIGYGPPGPEGWTGPGPVYLGATGHQVLGTNWGQYIDLVVVALPNVKGPVLLRGFDLKTDVPVVFVGPYSAGNTVGADAIDGPAESQHTELVLDPAHAPDHVGGTQADPPGSAGSGVWPTRLGVPEGWSNCVGIQVDAPNVPSEAIYLVLFF